MTASQTSPQPSTGQASRAERDPLASLRIERPDPRGDRRLGQRLSALWICGLLLLLAAGLLGYRHFRESGTSVEELVNRSAWIPEVMQSRAEVRLASVTVEQGRSADAVVVASGYLQSRRQARIGARAAGRVAIIAFEEGDRVTAGEVLAELEHKDMDAELAAAEATVAQAEAAVAEQKIAVEQAARDRERADGLWQRNAIAESEYEQFQFTHRAAVARQASLEAELSFTRARRQQSQQLRENMFIRAPFDGTVISKDAEVGESILPGGLGEGSGRGSVATIADLEHLEVECDVQEGYISRIRVGQEAEIAVDAVPDKRYHGSVRKIIPMGDRARATIKVQVEITDADGLLFPEMSGTVYFLPSQQPLEANDEPRFFCPASAVESGEDRSRFVWVVDEDNRAQKIVVIAGEERDGRIEILEGLTGSERVIVSPQDLSEGLLLQVVD